jgi:hypothetical protein
MPNLRPAFRYSNLGLALALLTNIELFWKGLSGTNALTYHELLWIADERSFIHEHPFLFFHSVFVKSFVNAITMTAIYYKTIMV